MTIQELIDRYETICEKVDTAHDTAAELMQHLDVLQKLLTSEIPKEPKR